MLLTSIPTLMVTVSRATRQDFLHLIKGMFKRMVEGLEPNKTKNEDSSKIGVLSCRYDNFLLKLGQCLKKLSVQSNINRIYVSAPI